MPTVPPAPPSLPSPPGWRLRRDASTGSERGGAVLLGGAPLRVLCLSAAGAAAVERWWAGRPIGDAPAERRLARRLLDVGLAHPDPPATAELARVTVVVPVRDRPDALRRCLAAIDRRCRVVVVDDASQDAATTASVAGEAGASVVRLDPGRGPAAARNAGMRAASTPFVAFVDSDCVVSPSFPGRLLDHLADQAIAVAVPRIVGLGTPGQGLLSRYEARHSGLDMGTREGLVRAGTAIPYAPSAALVARVDALGDGFDEDLPIGEDVDLLWRLADAGWQVRYDPAVTVAHDHRVAWRAWFARRVTYDTSSAMLVRRHPGKVPALRISRSGGVFWAAAAAGPPPLAAAVQLVRAATLGRVLRSHLPHPFAVAARLTAGGALQEGRQLARMLRGPWLPFLLAATVVRPRATRRIWWGLAVQAVGEWARDPAERTPLHDAVPRAAEDVARCVGVWRGCLRERRAGALLPLLRR